MDAPAAGHATDAPLAPDIPVDAPVVAVLGDSLAAGLHLARDEAFPAVLQRKLAHAGLPFRLVNAGVSGDTTTGGLERVDWLLRQDPTVVIVELGANDGFRGVELDTVEQNLRTILARITEHGATPLLLGVRLPPNYGPEYSRGFDAVYARVAKDLGVAFVPYFMEGVGGVLDMNLADGIHPTPEGHVKLADNVAPELTRVLREAKGK
jgi:acyl-CoA thioesterase-1